MVRTLALLALLAAPVFAEPPEDVRLLVKGEVNGKPVTLCFDTGCNLDLVLFRKSHERLGIEAGADNKRKVEFGIPGIGKNTMPAHLLDVAGLARFDGLIGWRCVRAPVVRIDMETLSVSYELALPDDLAKWDAFDISGDTGVLSILCGGEAGRRLKIFIDTGIQKAKLARAPWRALHEQYPDLPRTLSAGYSPAAGGTYVSQVTLAPELAFGRLRLERVLVAESAFRSELFEGHHAILGTHVLRRFDVLLDLRAGKAYLRRREVELEVPPYNRMGAVFLPKTLKEDDLIAHVLPDSPAARAGLRNGDVLLAIDGRDYTGWRKNPEIISKGRSAEDPAGTKHVFTVRRGRERVDVEVTLEEILLRPGEPDDG